MKRAFSNVDVAARYLSVWSRVCSRKETHPPSRGQIVTVTAAGTVEIDEPQATVVNGLKEIVAGKSLHLLVVVVEAELLFIVAPRLKAAAAASWSTVLETSLAVLVVFFAQIRVFQHLKGPVDLQESVVGGGVVGFLVGMIFQRQLLEGLADVLSWKGLRGARNSSAPTTR